MCTYNDFVTSKMKILIFLIVAKFLATSSCEPMQKLKPIVTNCSLLLPVNNGSHTIFFDMDINYDPELKTCILKNSLSERSVLLLNVYGGKINIKLNRTKKFIKTSDNPNVIIMTKYLTPSMVDSPLMRFFINSNWSLLYIIVTVDDKFNCENGTMNTNDFSLLDYTMNTLWQKFQIMRVGIVFPYACKHKMVIYKGKRPSTRNLYNRRIKLIDATNSYDISVAIKKSGERLAIGYPMQGSIFYRYPTSVKDCKNLHYYVPFNLNLTLGYCGLDGMVMHDIINHFKFNLSVPGNENCNTYGYAVPGNISGSLGCIVRKELDISFNSRFMTLYSDEHIYYLHYVTTDSLCALVRKTDVIPLWHFVFNVYTPPLWMLIISLLVVISVIMWAMGRINKSMTGQKTMTFWFYLYNTVTMTMIGYSPIKTKRFLMIRCMCLWGSILFAALYQGHISRVYTTMRRVDQIKTLEELYSSGTILHMSATITQFTKQLQNPEDDLQKTFFNRSYLIPDERIGIVLERKSAAALARKSDAEMEILEKFSDKDGTPLIDIVDECFHTYYLSYIARSGFPFFKEIKIFTERLIEAGLPTMYYKWTQRMLDVLRSVPQSLSQPRPFVKITLQDQRLAFVILFIGTIVSVIVFAAEVWKGSRKNINCKNVKNS